MTIPQGFQPGKAFDTCLTMAEDQPEDSPGVKAYMSGPTGQTYWLKTAEHLKPGECYLIRGTIAGVVAREITVEVTYAQHCPKRKKKA